MKKNVCCFFFTEKCISLHPTKPILLRSNIIDGKNKGIHSENNTTENDNDIGEQSNFVIWRPGYLWHCWSFLSNWQTLCMTHITPSMNRKRVLQFYWRSIHFAGYIKTVLFIIFSEKLDFQWLTCAQYIYLWLRSLLHHFCKVCRERTMSIDWSIFHFEIY